jgi:putative oxidoreductase
VDKNGFLGFRSLLRNPTIRLGCSLQRLFSTFPSGWPGLGLLLLRLGAGTTLISLGMNGLYAALTEPIVFAGNLIAVIGGIFLVAGLWTPVTGVVIALDELWTASSLYFSPAGGQGIHVLLAVLGASVAMLGPGAWSIDARRFGRKRFDIDRTRGKQPSP